MSLQQKCASDTIGRHVCITSKTTFKIVDWPHKPTRVFLAYTLRETSQKVHPSQNCSKSSMLNCAFLMKWATEKKMHFVGIGSTKKNIINLPSTMQSHICTVSRSLIPMWFGLLRRCQESLIVMPCAPMITPGPRQSWALHAHQLLFGSSPNHIVPGEICSDTTCNFLTLPFILISNN